LTSSQITNQVEPNATGNSGEIEVTTTGSLQLTEGARLGTATFGQGNGGGVTIQASGNVLIDGVGQDENGRERNSFISSRIMDNAVGDGGNINITASSVYLTNGGRLNLRVRGNGHGGNIEIIADNTVQMEGGVLVDGNPTGSGVISQMSRQGVGQSGNIEIRARSVRLINGGQVLSDTRGQGNAGDITIIAPEKVVVEGVHPLSSNLDSTIASSVQRRARGNGGNIRIETGSFSVANGAKLEAATRGRGDAGDISIQAGVFSVANSGRIDTRTEGNGDAGNIKIEAVSLVEIIGGGRLNVTTNGEGNAGNVEIDADTVSFRGISDPNAQTPAGSAVLSRVRRNGIGQGGDITIRARWVSLTDGGELLADTYGRGDSGNITIFAQEGVRLDGVNEFGPDSAIVSSVGVKDEIDDARGNGGNISIEVEAGSLFITNGAKVETASFAQGNAGEVTILARDGVYLDGVGGNGQLSRIVTNVDSQGTGQGGDIQIQAGTLTLNNQSLISAETASTDGGNITLAIGDILLLRHGSNISTTAGTDLAGGDGGDITINSDFIVAVDEENSDITANAFAGNGGNINITAQGIFGIQFREELTPMSDITASSEFGLDGVVAIDRPSVDPSRGLTQLPTLPRPVKVAEGCQAADESGAIAFFNIGRGGLASSPYESLSSTNIWDDVPQNPVSAAEANSPKQIVEAQGWIVDEQGNVVLVAEVPTSHVQGSCRLR
ncbi:MAG: hypothetical protein WA919_16990, partial [Coleofasciculaceae cyanobacterium]